MRFEKEFETYFHQKLLNRFIGNFDILYNVYFILFIVFDLLYFYDILLYVLQQLQ